MFQGLVDLLEVDIDAAQQVANIVLVGVALVRAELLALLDVSEQVLINAGGRVIVAFFALHQCLQLQVEEMIGAVGIVAQFIDYFVRLLHLAGQHKSADLETQHCRLGILSSLAFFKTLQQFLGGLHTFVVLLVFQIKLGNLQLGGGLKRVFLLGREGVVLGKERQHVLVSLDGRRQILELAFHLSL